MPKKKQEFWYLKHTLGCYVEAMALGKSCTQRLIEEADEFSDMDQDRKISNLKEVNQR